MKKVNVIIGCCFVAIATMVLSCQKNNTATPASSATVTDAQATDAQDISIAASTFDNVDAQILASSSGSLKADVVDSTEPQPITKVVHAEKGKIQKELNYDGITKNGKDFSGKITIVMTCKLGASIDTTKDSNWVRKVTFNNYKEGGRKLEGTKTITYKGKDANGHPYWEIKLDSGKITLKNGKVITFNYDRIRTQIAGDTTATLKDDVFQINGTGSGVNRRGIAYTTTSTNLIKANVCPYFESGTVAYVSDTKTISITYTGGTNCNPSATVTVDGKTKTINTDTETN
jgi:hypothetical protein